MATATHLAELRAGRLPLRHICESCGKDEILSPEESYAAGWDYPPKIGDFGMVSPRTCPSCTVQGTLWWALAIEKRPDHELTEAQLKTLERIQGEPWSILPEGCGTAMTQI